jgi:aspartate/methionine/tyrosine aminotransferase
MINFEPYPFEKLSRLLEGSNPPKEHQEVSLTIGEPQFETPAFIQDTLKQTTNLLKKYPKTAGEEELKLSLKGFVQRRFGISLDDRQIIPTFGTREVLFNFPQFYLFDKADPQMAFTNPFYQIYEGAALASRAKITHIDLVKENSFKPKFDEKIAQSNLVIINSPNNPTASSMSLDELIQWVEYANEYDFLLINDECYSEIYTTSKPHSLLEASIACGNKDFKNILVLNSISKRSSAPGLRSGLIAGDANILDGYAKYRTYIGCASPLPLQFAAAAAWSDALHSEEIRQRYIKSMHAACEILQITPSDTTFYLWLEVGDDEQFAKELYQRYAIKVLPGSYLGRDGAGKGYIRIALVYEEDIIKDACEKIKKLRENI